MQILKDVIIALYVSGGFATFVYAAIRPRKGVWTHLFPFVLFLYSWYGLYRIWQEQQEEERNKV